MFEGRGSENCLISLENCFVWKVEYLTCQFSKMHIAQAIMVVKKRFLRRLKACPMCLLPLRFSRLLEYSTSVQNIYNFICG